MALNLVKAGYPVGVYDVRPEPVAELAGQGARAAGSLRELGDARTVVVMVLSYPQMEGVVLGPGGLAAALQPGSTVIGSSTIAPDQARSLAAALGERGIHYVDAPVSGGKAGADAGALTIMVGAEPEVFATSIPRPLVPPVSTCKSRSGAVVPTPTEPHVSTILPV